MFIEVKNPTPSLSTVPPKVQLSGLSTGLSYYKSHDDSAFTTSLFKPLWNYPLYTSSGFFFFFFFCCDLYKRIMCVLTLLAIFSIWRQLIQCYQLSTWNTNEKVRKLGVIWCRVAVQMVPNFLVIFKSVRCEILMKRYFKNPH